MAAAEEQHRRAQCRALRLAGRALLQEAAERRQPRAGADHDDRHGRIVRQAEARLGLAHGGMDGVANTAAGKIVRADALVDAAAGAGRRLHHTHRDAAALRIARRRGRDRVVARREQRQHFEVGVERKFAGRELFEQIEHRLPLRQHVVAIELGGSLVVPDISEQFRLGHRAARVLGHDLDLLARGNLLQLDEFGEQASDRDGFADRQLGAAAFRHLQADLVRRQEAEPARHRIDQRRIVARHHGQVVADAVGQARRQLHLDVPGRTLRRIGAGFVLQLVANKHFHRRGTAERDDGVDRGRRHWLDGIERFIVGAASEAGVEAELLHRSGSRLGEPALELAVEVAPGIALAALIDTARAMGLELLVDQARHRLVGRGPIAVAAAEHGIAHIGESAFWQIAAAKPLHELRGIVRRRAVVGGAEDQHAAFGRQLAGMVVERRELRREAVDLGQVSDACGEFFRRAEVGAVEHQQRRVVAGPGPRPRRSRAGGCRGNRLGSSKGATVRIGALAHLDPESVGLDRQRFFQLHLVAMRIDQLEALQDHADGKRRLMHGKTPADAGALAVAERLPGVDRPFRFGLGGEIPGIEHVRVRAPDAGIAVQGHHQHGDEGTLLQLVLAADGLVLERRDAVGWRWRPHPQRFLQDLRDVGELRHLLIGRLGIDVGAEHPVDFLIGLLEDFGMLQERIDRAG